MPRIAGVARRTARGYRALVGGALAHLVAFGAACKSTSPAAGTGHAPSAAALSEPRVENASADCVVSALADPSQLPEHETLPDPFLKLDGTRLATRSEWRCRR